MRGTGTRALCMLALAFAAACGPFVFGDIFEEDEHTELLPDTSMDEAWSAAIEAFRIVRIPLDNLDRDSGVLTTDWHLIDDTDDVMTCPDGADRNRQGRFNVFLSEVQAGVEVTINVSYRAEDDLGSMKICRTNGELEEEILRHMRART